MLVSHTALAPSGFVHAPLPVVPPIARVCRTSGHVPSMSLRSRVAKLPRTLKRWNKLSRRAPKVKSWRRGAEPRRSDRTEVAPFFVLSPFGFVGGGFGYPFFGPDLGTLFTIALFVFFIQNFMSAPDLIEGDGYGYSPFDGDFDTVSSLGNGVGVIRLNVALFVSDRSSSSTMLAYLATLAGKADTESRRGLANLASDACIGLLRRSNAWTAADVSCESWRARVRAPTSRRVAPVTEPLHKSVMQYVLLDESLNYIDCKQDDLVTVSFAGFNRRQRNTATQSLNAFYLKPGFL